MLGTFKNEGYRKSAEIDQGSSKIPEIASLNPRKKINFYRGSGARCEFADHTRLYSSLLLKFPSIKHSFHHGRRCLVPSSGTCNVLVFTLCSWPSKIRWPFSGFPHRLLEIILLLSRNFIPYARSPRALWQRGTIRAQHPYVFRPTGRQRHLWSW